MKKVHIDKQDNILGWYDDKIHSNIPADTIEVDDSVWENAITINANSISNGTPVYLDKRTKKDKDKEKEKREWSDYKDAKEAKEKEDWIASGKPKFI